MKKRFIILLKNKVFLILVFFILLSLFQIIIWFRNSYIYGGGDVGLQTFNPKRIVNISLYPWWEAVAPGLLIPLAVTNIPFEFGLSILQTLGFSNLQLQAITFFLLFFLMGFGMYLFLMTIFRKNHSLSILGALFYLYNPYMLLNIWHRFVHTSIFFVAVLPYLVILWRKWIKSGEIKFLLSFLLINLFASYMFGTLAFIITLWIFIGLLTLFELIFPLSNKRLLLSQISRFFLGFISWLFTNTWWIIPFLGSSYQYSQQYSQNNNLVELIGISKQAILPYILQMVNPFSLFDQLDFGPIYNSFLFKFIPWISIVVVFIGFLKSLRDKGFVSFGLLTLILIFLAKGSSPPLGGLFVWGFNHLFAIGVLRNPAEKVGLLLPFVYTILFVIGFLLVKDYLLKTLPKRITKPLWVIVLLPNLIFCWPFFTQHLFGNINAQATVNIPKEYQEVNNFIKSEIPANLYEDQGRILHLPLPIFEAVTYNWEPKYRGVESNILLFDSYASLSRTLNLLKFDDYLKGLSFTFMSPYSQNKEAILKALQNYNVKIIILHQDSDYLTDGIVNPEELEKLLDNLYFVKRIYKLEKLVVYRVEDKYFDPKVVLSENPYYIRSGENNNVWLFQAGDIGNSLSDSQSSKINKNILEHLRGSEIFADKSFRFFQASNSAILNPAFHNSIINKLESSKKQADFYKNADLSNSLNLLLSATQLLTQFSTTDRNNQSTFFNTYQGLISELLDNKKNSSLLLTSIDEPTLRLIFQEHWLLLDQMKLDSITSKLVSLLSKSGVFPKNLSSEEIKIGTDRQVFNIQIPNSANYEILMTKAFDPKDFNGQLTELPFLIEGQKESLKSSDSGNTLSFGIKRMDEGFHEISYPTLFSKNLLILPKEWKIIGGKINESEINLETKENSPSIIEIPFSGIEGGGLYHFNVDIMFKQGPRFYVQLLQDSDPIDNNKQPIMEINQYFVKQDIGDDWRNLNFDTNLRMTTKNAKLRFILLPDTSIIGTSSLLLIRNLSIQKVLNNSIFLRNKERDLFGEYKGTYIKINHPNPVFYSGELTIEKPSFLFLKETYNQGWILRLKNNETDTTTNDHYVGDLYGNAWFIEKPGKYSFQIEFEPFKYNKIGLILSLIFYISLILIISRDFIKGRFYD